MNIRYRTSWQISQIMLDWCPLALARSVGYDVYLHDDDSRTVEIVTGPATDLGIAKIISQILESDPDHVVDAVESGRVYRA